MMEVENRIEETFSGQVEELPDDLKERRVHGNQQANGNGNGVILEESEEEDQGDAGMEKTPTDASQAIAGRVIKKAKRPTKASSFSEPGAPVGFPGVARTAKNLRKSRNA